MEKPISFKAVTEGLGFHPFADGLPYAPMAPSQKQEQPRPPRPMGAGAEAAGQPSFVRGPSRATVSPAASGLEFGSEFVVIPQKRAELPPTRPAQPQEISLSVDAHPTVSVPESHGYSYLVKRSAAYILDTAINCSLGGGALVVIARAQNLKIELLIEPGILLVFFGFLAILNWALMTAQEVAFGSTVGKRTFGLYLEATPGKILLRSLFFVLSLVFSGVGLIWAIFDSKKRCWHDVAAGVQPNELARF